MKKFQLTTGKFIFTYVIQHIKKFKFEGLKFCYPVISYPLKEIYNNDGFDLALAQTHHNGDFNIVQMISILKKKKGL